MMISRRARLLSACLVTLGLAACGPMTVDQAERACFDNARRAAGPTGNVGIGIGTGGSYVGGDVAISSDWLRGRDPAVVYETCVMAKSGEAPRRPLYQRPDWKG